MRRWSASSSASTHPTAMTSAHAHFSEPNWQVGDTVALRDRIYRVYRVVYLDDDGEVRGMLMLEERSPSDAD